MTRWRWLGSSTGPLSRNEALENVHRGELVIVAGVALYAAPVPEAEGIK
jgi:hypothetical protein